jgi:hypothetical protein
VIEVYQLSAEKGKMGGEREYPGPSHLIPEQEPVDGKLDGRVAKSSLAFLATRC